MIPRCSFFFANPNMAAVLFVQLAVAGRCLCPRFPRAGAALAFLASLAVVLTGSRGGFLALAVGFALLECVKGAALRGRWRNAFFRRRGALAASTAIVAALVLLAALFASGLAGRFAAMPRDGSVTNRLALWKAVPRMMADAPGGWGLGRSGAAFVDWYQPLDRHEEYRTLVGSHQTLLVEFGTLGRILYLFAWLLVLTVAFRHARKSGNANAAAQWSALAVAATFSSVLEIWGLWIIPVIAFVPVVRDLRAWRLGAWTWSGLAAGALVPILCVMAFARGERRFEDSGRLSRSVPAEVSGTRWLVPDARVLGRHWPRRVRATDACLCTAETVEMVDADAGELTVCGANRRVARERFPHLRRVIYLSPRFRPLVCDPSFERIVVGEFASDVPDAPPPGVTVVPGLADYLDPGPTFRF